MNITASRKFNDKFASRLTAWIVSVIFGVMLALTVAGSDLGLSGISGAQAVAIDQTKGQAQDTPTVAECSPDWAVVSTPNYSQHDYLRSIAVVSATDLWAAGEYHNGSVYQTLIEHWDGTAWIVVPSPNMSTGTNWLNGIAAASENDVWAAGYYNDGVTDRTLIEHWDGNVWSVVPSPNADPPDNNYLNAVAVVSATDVWAVGGYLFANSVFETLIEHWDGTAWTVVPSPDPSAAPANDNLYGVAATSRNDVWAVGSSVNGYESQTLTEHWDGITWKIVPSPNAGIRNTLSAVAAVGTSASDVWAVGTYFNGNVGTDQTLTEHWDGNAWSVVPSPNVYITINKLYGVAVVSSDDVWAVGWRVAGPAALIEHWDGSAWSLVGSPDAYPFNTLFGVAASEGDVWAVGSSFANGSDYALIERYNPCILSCPIQFQDISPDHTFYPYARCLACRGIISGYACGSPDEPCVPPNNYPYFRPNNTVTRGEITKIVALSAQLNLSISGQTFEDVPPGSSFYTYTEQLAELGVMNGYPCGNPEPCVPPFNRPYFRPSNRASRGQFAKIDANAAGFNDFVGGGVFLDVPSGSPFYTYIERLESRGIVQGYPCGGPGEPCNPPYNNPYFRPGDDVTRGQITKMVGDTFYPYCYTP